MGCSTDGKRRPGASPQALVQAREEVAEAFPCIVIRAHRVKQPLERGNAAEGEVSGCTHARDTATGSPDDTVKHAGTEAEALSHIRQAQVTLSTRFTGHL